ncbi:MAG: holo-ACP synthase [Nitrospirota bacterium]|jgi:holo-[acyl-carrier protein] synthase|nr:holo-ACP synthase [Nitrospirota bacterium]
MIYGVGIDLVKIDRMKEVVEKWGQRFLERVFTAGEISYCYEKKNPYLSLSVRFAAKEALIKAIGSAGPVALTDIEVINVDTGKPFLKINGRLEVFIKEKSIRRAHLSLSHEHEYGVACVVLEQGER